ncbi:MAG: CoA-binding protein [Planctomycetes bacterium]|nr:CoA-binding protein [Planctomycetota bacterium]
MTDLAAAIRAFLAAPPFAVVGASNDPAKFGARVLAAYRRAGLRAYPVNPREREVQGLPCHPNLAALPEPVLNVSIITPPAVTERIVEEAARAGARCVWMQPGAESDAAVARARGLGLEVISGGPCVLVELRA